jgi:hypothetical protein
MKLTAENVQAVVLSALFTEKERREQDLNDTNTGSAVVVHGVRSYFGFHPERIKAVKPQVAELLSHLADGFFQDAGEGLSFICLRETKAGEVWAEDPRVADDLICLALATGLGEFCLPREKWDVLPGGMPYIRFFRNLQ